MILLLSFALAGVLCSPGLRYRIARYRARLKREARMSAKARAFSPLLIAQERLTNRTVILSRIKKP